MEEPLVRLLKIKHMRLITAIAEHGQLGKAAEIMSMTQPAASRMLAEIESIIGAPLFERCAKGMDLTQIGQLIAQRSTDILLDLRDLNREVHNLKHGQEGRASVGAVNGAALNLLIPAVRKVKETSPKAEIHINVESSPILIGDLIEGKNDFVLARLRPDLNLSDFLVEAAGSESIRILVDCHHPLVDAADISLKDLIKYEWIMQRRPNPLREALDEAFMQTGIPTPTNILYTSSLPVIIGALSHSTSVAPLPSEVTDLLISSQAGFPRLKALQITEPIMMPPYYFLQMKGRRLAPIANRLKAIVLDQIHAKNHMPR